MNYGFIGVGNMASAIIRGMTAGYYTGDHIYGYNRTISKTDLLRDMCGIHSCTTMKEAVEAADILVLAVKPNTLPEVISEVKAYLKDRKPLIISLAVGKTLEYLEGEFGPNFPIVRVMPNINAKVNASTSGFCANASTSPEQKQLVRDLLLTIGNITEIEEKDFSVFGVVAGSAPAFAYLYMDALARAAQKSGMNKKLALELVAHSVMGSAKMLLESEEHPWSFIDQVCSPGGTTIEGIAELQANAFEATITEAFDAVLRKDKKIQGK